jgi:hypothetical protein
MFLSRKLFRRELLIAATVALVLGCTAFVSPEAPTSWRTPRRRHLLTYFVQAKGDVIY